MAVRRLAAEQPESFAFTADNQAWAEATIRKFPHGRQASAVIPLLWRVQEQEGWVTKPAMEAVARMLDMPLIRVLEVATFYTMFHLQPVGRTAHVQVCGTTPCMLRGAGGLIEVCKSRIAPHPHEVSADGAFSWEEVECLGACVNAPMVQIFKDTYEDLTPDSFHALLDAFARGEVPEPGPQTDRQFSAPATGPTTLTELSFAAAGGGDGDRRRRSPRGPAPAESADLPAEAPHPARDEVVGGESLAAEQERRRGRVRGKGGGVDPATAAAAGQEAARPDPTGRSDEAASRAMGARRKGKPAAGESEPEGGLPPRQPRGRGKKA